MYLVKHRGAREVIVDDLGVGHVARVVEREPTADAHYSPWQLRLAEHPSGDVDFVDALIARLAVACVPEEAAIVLQTVAIDRLHPCRAAPEFVIDVVGDW